MDKETVDLFAASGADGVAAMTAAMKNGIGADVTALSGHKDMMAEVAKALDGSDIAKLPTDLANALRGVIAESGDTNKVFASGGSVREALGSFGYDESTGSIKNNAGFDQALKKSWSTVAKNVNPGALAANGGVNDFSMAMISEADAGALKTMAGERKSSRNAKAMVESAFAIRDANTGAMVSDYEKKMVSGGASPEAEQKATAAYAARLEQTKAKAEKLIEEVGGPDSPLAAAVNAGVDKARRALWDEAKADYAADQAKVAKRLSRSK
jgi:hypothetical protein